jgi:hypothetical protein
VEAIGELRYSCLILGPARVVTASFLIGVFLGAGSFLTLATFFGVAAGLGTLLLERLRLDGDGFLGVLLLAC